MDFRKQLEINRRKTKLVIASYILIMAIVGLLADTSFAPIYPESMTASMIGFLKLEAIPYATIVIVSITLIGIFLISKFGHKFMMAGMEDTLVTPENNIKHDERQVYNIVEEMSISANLGYMPSVHIMETDELNAFAAGWNKHNAMVAVTRGLMNRLNRNELQAVIAHEVAHIVHGDSRLTLYVGILANVILTITNIFAHLFFFLRSNNPAANNARLLLMVLNLVLPLVTKVLYFYLSRSREYMADSMAVQLTGDNTGMINALRKISNQEVVKHDAGDVGESFRHASYIYVKGDSVFSTHPSVENRIKALEGQ